MIRSLRYGLLFLGLAACGAPTLPPTLDLVVPSSVSAGTPITIKATATTGAGTIGAGTVKFSSATGTLDNTEVTFDSFGTATAKFSCEPTCTEGTSFTITAQWKSKDGTANASGHTTVPAAMVVVGPPAPPESAQAFLTSCEGQSKPLPDDVSVYGTVGGVGAVAVRIRSGVSAGVSFGPTGGQFFTSGTMTGTPMIVNETGLWIWPSTNMVQTGVLYRETNANTSFGGQYMNFDLTTNQNGYTTYGCPQGGGYGTLAFNRVTFFPSNDGGITSGAFTFKCPDAGIDVYGCFAFN